MVVIQFAFSYSFPFCEVLFVPLPLRSFDDILFFDLASPHDKLATRYFWFKIAQAHTQS